jgi:hypothetical protein
MHQNSDPGSVVREIRREVRRPFWTKEKIRTCRFRKMELPWVLRVTVGLPTRVASLFRHLHGDK